jgi:LAO/AO transport system kinase
MAANGERPSLVERLLGGDVRALARGITLIEEGHPRAEEVLRRAYGQTGRATVIGVTGAPGSGKSSLVDRLVAAYRRAGRRVGVVAVDPSSAFSGGAILGDRVRMQQHARDPDVYIRSMATRGHLGGLARATNDVIDLLDATGYDPVIVETVGVGQDEVDVVRTADAVAVVLVPGMGDDVQAIKAGILEIADLFVINKADRDGADRLESDLDNMLSLVEDDSRPRPAIYRTVAIADRGIGEVVDGVDAFLAAAGRERRAQRRRDRAEARFLAVLAEAVVDRVRRRALPEEGFSGIVDDIAERRVDPYSAARRVVERVEVR